jgi:PAS domain S-box-containing protein
MSVSGWRNLGGSASQLLFDATSDALFVHDVMGRYLLVNQQACTMFRCTADEILAHSFTDFSSNEPPYTPTEAKEHVRYTLTHGARSFEWQSRRYEGELFWSEVALRRFEVDGVPYVMASVRDVDARKRLDTALQESEQRFEAIFNGASMMLAFTERAEGRIVAVNDAWLGIMGAKREDVLGKTGDDLGIWANTADRDRIVENIDARERTRSVETQMFMGGRTLPVLLSAQPVERNGERFVLWELLDLTERRRVEQEQEALKSQLLQAQKMESIGQLAGGIAHDFNNILTAIVGFGSLVRERMAQDSEEAEYITEILNAAERANSLTRQLLAFSRKQSLKPRTVDPAQLLRGLEAMLGRLIGENIFLKLVLSPSTSPIRVDISQFEQVIMNLVVNARDAMPDGGTLTLETSDVDFDESYVSVHAEAAVGPHVVITVSDTGVGMDAATKTSAFEPFFTTKAFSKGTGLGLSTVYGIIKQSGGWICLDSEPGRGTTFRLYFPRSAFAAEPIATDVPELTCRRGDAVILLAEDDPQVRVLVAKVLSNAGYTVLVAGDPLEAVALSQGYKGEIHLLLTDVVMPYMNGRQLAEKIASTRPTTRVMYVSGYTKDVIGHQGEIDQCVNFLAKPISPKQLLDTVARVLE